MKGHRMKGFLLASCLLGAAHGACPVDIRLKLDLHGAAYASAADLANAQKSAPLVAALETALGVKASLGVAFNVSSCASRVTAAGAESTTCVVEMCQAASAEDKAAAEFIMGYLQGGAVDFESAVNASLPWTTAVAVQQSATGLTCASCDFCPAKSHAPEQAVALASAGPAGAACAYQPGLCSGAGADARLATSAVSSATDFAECCAACGADVNCAGWEQVGTSCSLLSSLGGLLESYRSPACGATGAKAGAAFAAPAPRCRACGVGQGVVATNTPVVCKLCRSGFASVHGVCTPCRGDTWSNKERSACSGSVPVWKQNWFLGLMVAIVVAFAMFRQFRQCCERKAKGEPFEPTPIVPEGSGAAIVARENEAQMQAPAAAGGGQGQGPFVL